MRFSKENPNLPPYVKQGTQAHRAFVALYNKDIGTPGPHPQKPKIMLFWVLSQDFGALEPFQ